MNQVNEVTNLKKLSIEKKTIRNLTADETDDVAGGISPVIMSSTLCFELVTIGISMAVC